MMNFNPADLLKISSAFNTFKNNHPKFIPFFKTAGPKLNQAGTVLEIAVTDVNGEKLETNLRIQESDMELIKTILAMGN